MQRTSKETVSSRTGLLRKVTRSQVPILIPAGERRPDGWATFDNPDAPPFEHRPLRELGHRDFEVLFERLDREDQDDLRALIELHSEIEQHPEESYWLEYFRQNREVFEQINASFDKSKRLSFHRKFKMAIEQRDGDPITLLSMMFSDKVRRSELVLWTKAQPRKPGSWKVTDREIAERARHLVEERGKGFLPAVYCPDALTACYVFELFRFYGRGFGICLECNEVFQKDSKGSPYCCPSHADAYRVRKWRAEQRKKKLGKGTGGKNQ